MAILLASLQEAFGAVVFVVVIAGAVIALITFAGTGKLYDQIGRGMFSLRDGRDSPPREPAPAIASAERDAEIRQMLQARNDRRARKGLDTVDIEGELRQLTAPSVDPGLREEVRQLVVARNHRRARQGKPPLDVEAEIERQLQALG